MSEERWDQVLGDIFAAMDRDAAAERQLIAIAPRLSDEQILRAWARAVPWRMRPWGALCAGQNAPVAGRQLCSNSPPRWGSNRSGSPAWHRSMR